MSVFLDTNVVVYAFDRADPAKQRIAIEVFEGKERLVVSSQVLLESWWVLTLEPVAEAAADELSRRRPRSSEHDVMETVEEIVA